MASKEYKQRAKLASKLEKELSGADTETSIHWQHAAMARGVIKKSGRQVLTHVVCLESYSDSPHKFLSVIPVKKGGAKQPKLSDEPLILETAGWEADPGALYSSNHRVLGEYEGPTDANALATLEEAVEATPLPVDGRITALVMGLVA